MTVPLPNNWSMRAGQRPPFANFMQYPGFVEWTKAERHHRVKGYLHTLNDANSIVLSLCHTGNINATRSHLQHAFRIPTEYSSPNPCTAIDLLSSAVSSFVCYGYL
mmetsp:Transcript_9804/g.16542  ORF Transcript_9804/g.16542 Transcript_9804/m.16542 type:complete len:106 (-) Transcript_9804:186-503(-)